MELQRQQERLTVAVKGVAIIDSSMSQLDALEIQRLRDVAAERIKGHKQYIAQAEAELRPARERLAQQAPLSRPTSTACSIRCAPRSPMRRRGFGNWNCNGSAGDSQPHRRLYCTNVGG